MEEDYKDLSERLKALLEVYYNRMAERAEGNAWLSLINSGWFQQYSGYAGAMLRWKRKEPQYLFRVWKRR